MLVIKKETQRAWSRSQEPYLAVTCGHALPDVRALSADRCFNANFLVGPQPSPRKRVV
ncbi:hypothetical protein JCM1841_003844, partial [Sporobolomyces salmonicolor]